MRIRMGSHYYEDKICPHCGATRTARTDSNSRCVSCSHKGPRTHGMTGTPTYDTWTNMISRCKYESCPSYPNYGGRGIKVCYEWLTFAGFLADMGERSPDWAIHRLDSDGDYTKDNCEWIDKTQHAREHALSRERAANGSWEVN